MTIQREALQSGVRQYLHRMIISMGDELFNYIPLAVSLLLKDCQVCIRGEGSGSLCCGGLAHYALGEWLIIIGYISPIVTGHAGVHPSC